MSLEIRPITPDQFPAFLRCAGTAFGHHHDQEDIDAERMVFEFDWSLAVFDGPAIVGTAGAFSLDLTLPGLSSAPVAGVAYVAVLPTHRRRGLLRRLMARQLDDVNARGEPLAILYATESSIYGRFGYGVASFHLGFTIERHHANFYRPPRLEGRIDLADPEAAASVIPGVYEKFRRRQPGGVDRSPNWWDLYFKDIASWRDGASARFYVISHDASGVPDGYAAYRIKSDWQGGLPQHTLIAHDVFGLSTRATASLWDYLLNVDLTRTIQAWNRPIDDPLRWLLAEPRRMQITQFSDDLWLRLVDVPVALQARSYGATGELVLEVLDPFRERTTRYHLEADPEGAVCRATSASPDLTLQVDDLAAAYLGGSRFSTLARACRVTEHSTGALSRADTLFACEPAPWGTTHF
jgi:predicted acetyltransferase